MRRLTSTWLFAMAVTVAVAAALVAGSVSPAVPASATASTTGSAPAAVTAPAAAPLAPDTLRTLRRAASAGDPWNVVVILTDDQPVGTVEDMPVVRRELMGRGITYPAAVVPTPVCCPSRASLLTGLFAQRTGVYDNSRKGSPGGVQAFITNGNEQRTFALALHRLGYRTGLFGKYLNEYKRTWNGAPPPGWDMWRVFAGPGRYKKYSVTLPYDRADRRRVSTGLKARRSPLTSVHRYSTTYFGKLTADFIRSTPRRRPLLALYAPYAPHSPSKPADEYDGALTDTGWWRTDPSVMEADVSDKPIWVGRHSVSWTVDRRPMGELLVRQRETLLSVDDEVERIMTALADTGRLERTLVIYLSDNGYAHGQHRLTRKNIPYRAAIEVPMILRVGDELDQGVVDGRPVAANVDTAATVLALAGAGNGTQGRSLLRRPVRTGVPLTGAPYLGDEGGRPAYCGWRTPTEMFVRYGSGEEEYYDYSSDPYELDNRVADPAVAARVGALRNQARLACRPAPPDFGPSFDQPTWRYGDPVPPADGEVPE